MEPLYEAARVRSVPGLGAKVEVADGVTTRVRPPGHAEGRAQKQHGGVKPDAAGESPARPHCNPLLGGRARDGQTELASESGY